ncbi:phenazine biosynthesis protein PhzA/PhzB [Streptomyces cyaneogriseus subsp. noncyanogenus]|uniref:Phenazine biosynthesis protein PhzA/PhzB n=1 Tax=Streptomyces cyaneogriseus subsp. noncyanogenus TaxID=477245 RepID=A0A0C5FYP1_9ACTN|nr:nuclear transport factor 2 family protein [Streptomyces cyaneogriseus]AJP01485.1 phenazine biosynthesis protein PhzA/PhzB [Streptomyces cyaneogriseus subsp. noncyanogenus]
MPTDTRPADVYRHGLRLLLGKDIPAWVDLWHDEGVFEFPFAPEGWPKRLEGKAAVADYMRAYPDHIDLHDVPELTIHETGDPETIVAEMRAVGRLVRSGDPYEMSYIAVVTVSGGRITRYRDYWNPLALPQDGTADFAGGRR